MENIRQYIFTLICMAILCGLIPVFFDSGSTQRKLLKFAAGVLMMIVAITPLTGKDLLRFDFISTDLNQETQDAMRAGQDQANDMLRQIITERTEAYILDKAKSMGANLSAEVILSDTELPTPETVILTGTASPYVKKQLRSMLMSDLAISEEELQWN